MITLTWLGPYPIDQLFVPGIGLISVQFGSTVTVTASVADGMLAADQSWWTALLDGGNASSTYADGIDGGTSRTQAAASYNGPGATG